MLFETLSDNAGLFFNFTIVKIKGPNKRLELEFECKKMTRSELVKK